MPPHVRPERRQEVKASLDERSGARRIGAGSQGETDASADSSVGSELRAAAQAQRQRRRRQLSVEEMERFAEEEGLEAVEGPRGIRVQPTAEMRPRPPQVVAVGALGRPAPRCLSL